MTVDAQKQAEEQQWIIDQCSAPPMVLQIRLAIYREQLASEDEGTEVHDLLEQVVCALADTLEQVGIKQDGVAA